MTKRFLGLSMVVGAVFIAGAARAGDVPFAADLGPNEHITGTVDQDDSSGDMNGATGVAAGPVAGTFTLNRINPHIVLDGPGLKLHVDFDRGDQSVSAHLDTCASPDQCSAGTPVSLWEK